METSQAELIYSAPLMERLCKVEVWLLSTDGYFRPMEGWAKFNARPELRKVFLDAGLIREQA